MSVYLEHANMHVADVDGMLDFILAALPEYRIRHDSGLQDPERWVHIGDDLTYLALYQANKTAVVERELYSGEVQVNHFGFVVPDAEAVRLCLLAKGYRETTVPGSNSHPARKRVYFRDGEGNEWEFVEYLSVRIGERNDYA